MHFSHFSDFGHTNDLENVCKQFKSYFDRNYNENKNKVVSCYKNREFDVINDILNKNESMKSSFFMQCTQLTLTFISFVRFGSNPHVIQGIFQKEYSQISSVCDDDISYS